MAQKYLSEIRAEIRQFLKDEFVSSDLDYTWEDDELDVYIDRVVREISRVNPNMVIEVLLTTEDTTILDISGISDLMWIEKIEYPVGQTPRRFRNVIDRDRTTVEIDTTLTPDAGSSGTLTGIVTFSSGSTTVTGSGTDFDGELEEGYHIRPSGKTRWYRIDSIESDTSLTLEEPVRSGDAGADTEDATPYYTDKVAYLICAKTHILSDTESTLNPQQEFLLIDGILAYAAISKSRGYINTQNISNRALSEMMAWGQNKLAIYRADLRSLRSSRVYKEYPKG